VEFCQRALADGAIPVLLCYSLGKSQEVLRALAPAGLPVMLHAEAFRFTQIYQQLGVTFPAFREFDAREVGGHVVICPPHSRGLLSRVPALRTAVVTGWALDAGAIYRHRADAAFPLSDHADFPSLLRFVELVQPKQVFTVHGFAREFAATLRARGLEAFALGQANQLEFSLSE
jgi:Cft2 family RNA processing exonuclease